MQIDLGRQAAHDPAPGVAVLGTELSASLTFPSAIVSFNMKGSDRQHMKPGVTATGRPVFAFLS